MYGKQSNLSFAFSQKQILNLKNQNKFKVCYELHIRQITYFKAIQTDMRCFGKLRPKGKNYG